jgi:metacaspase-1
MTRKALCVGINDYQNFPDAALKGCVNDANDMTGILKDFMGFEDADITVLTDEAATKANIMDGLKAMVDLARKGKCGNIVLSMSSYGTQVFDPKGDETTDHVDEALCPYDLASSGDHWDYEHVIADYELHDLFMQLPSNVVFEIYLDTCHSGAGLNALDLVLDRKPRFMPQPSITALKDMKNKKSRGISRLFLDQGITQHIIWTGCRSDQVGSEANIDGTWHGVFTNYFCKEMRECRNEHTRGEILKRVRKDLADGNYPQTPQLECREDVRNLTSRGLI